MTNRHVAPTRGNNNNNISKTRSILPKTTINLSSPFKQTQHNNPLEATHKIHYGTYHQPSNPRQQGQL